MKVNAWKNIDVEFEAEVSMDDILNEFWKRADESSDTYWRRLLPAVDSMTKILANIPQETIDAMPEAARSEISKRLRAQLVRWEKLLSTANRE